MSSRSRSVPPVSPGPEVIELWATLPPAPEKWWAKGFQLRWFDDSKLPKNVLIRYEVPEDAGYTIPPHPNRTRMVLRWEHDSNLDRRNMFVSTSVEYGSQEWHDAVDTATKSGTRPLVDPVSALEEMMEYKARVGRLNPKEAVPADGMTWSEILRVDQSKRVDLFTNLDTATTPLFRQPGSAHADALERSTWRFRYEEVARPAVSSAYNLSDLPELPIRPNPGALAKAIARGYVDADERPVLVVVNKKATTVARERALQEANDYLEKVRSLNLKEAVPADGMTWSEITQFSGDERTRLFTNHPDYRNALADARELKLERVHYDVFCRRDVSAPSDLPTIPNPEAREKAVKRGVLPSAGQAEGQAHDNSSSSSKDDSSSSSSNRVDPALALEEMMEYKARVGRLNPKEAVPADGMTWSEILRVDQSKRVDLFTNLDTATTPLFRQPGSAHADALERSTWRFRYEEVARPAVSSAYNLSDLPELPIRPNPGALAKAIARGYVDADEQAHNNNNNNENNNVATYRHATKDANTPDGTHI